jgi:hypothetical protein
MANIRYAYRLSKTEFTDITAEQLQSLIQGASFSWELKGNSLLGHSGAHLAIVIHGELEIFVNDFGAEYELPINIMEGNDGMRAVDIERRIHALRQMYAVVVLLKSGRADRIQEQAKYDFSYDLEEKFLERDEYLHINSIGAGSVFVTLGAISQNAKHALIYLVTMCSASNRQSVQRQLRADAKSAELEAEKKEFDLAIHKMKEAAKIAKELSKLSPDHQRIVETIIWRNAKVLKIEPLGLDDPSRLSEGNGEGE